MKFLIKTLLREALSNVSNTLTQFYDKVNQLHNNFLANHFKNPNFELRLTNEVGVKEEYYWYSKSNKCETNVFNFIKEKLSEKRYNYYPVSGWAFYTNDNEYFGYFEHFWVYDSIHDLFLEVTPLHGDLPYAYGGVINKNINQDIYNAKNFYDIDFLKGKASTSLYSKFDNQESKPKLKGYSQSNKTNDEKMFDYINQTQEFIELSKFLKDNYPNVSTIKELSIIKNKIDDALNKTKNSREFNYYDKLYDEIVGILNYFKKDLSNQN